MEISTSSMPYVSRRTCFSAVGRWGGRYGLSRHRNHAEWTEGERKSGKRRSSEVLRKLAYTTKRAHVQGDMHPRPSPTRHSIFHDQRQNAPN